jgi:cytochrome c
MLLAVGLAGCGSSPAGSSEEDPVALGAVVFRRCAACHTIGSGGSDTDGPNLYGVVGAAVAMRRVRYGYTANLRALGGVWTQQRLNIWLTNPSRLVPGTSMAFAGLSNPEDRANVIAFLAAQGPAH